MARLEDLAPGAMVKGILPGQAVTVVSRCYLGTGAAELVYKDGIGRLGTELVDRGREPALEVVSDEASWRFDADGSRFRLALEAKRIQLAHLFDPYHAVHGSLIEPLPHQITAVYEQMLPRQPLRFLLADDPGAGKTIMAGLLIKELLLRSDIENCLVVCPGSLVSQWQRELKEKFGLPFSVATNDSFTLPNDNWFRRHYLAICRLDKLSRDAKAQQIVREIDWDLIICDEAHKMSATFSGGRTSRTKRYRLGEALATRTRHFLLLTATPHNGKQGDFELFMRLLDRDRSLAREYLHGRARPEWNDLMRRLVKEQLLTFDGKRLFPRRHAHTIPYVLTQPQRDFYEEVTDYVRHQFNRADVLQGARRRSVGFALTILQRRLASSPEAIYQSLRRRRERLKNRLAEEHKQARVHKLSRSVMTESPFIEEALDDPDEVLPDEIEELEVEIADQATASVTFQDLEYEIAQLRDLERQALHLLRNEPDQKWEELSSLLTSPAMFDDSGHRRKIIIFTEHRDTLDYLYAQVVKLLGREAVVRIDGRLTTDQRQDTQNAFVHHDNVHVLVATDAAGEGINLQVASLMVNYDLPWNPNRIEQRFGRIHRIGQRHDCHLWNLLAADTREGDVYITLLRKLEVERKALGDRVFDVIGKIDFSGMSLHDLMIQAVRAPNYDHEREQFHRFIDEAIEVQRARELLTEHALARDVLDVTRVTKTEEKMVRSGIRRLHPHSTEVFFLKAFTALGGEINERELRRYEISRIPASINQYCRTRGTFLPERYRRVVFDKAMVHVDGREPAELLSRGHALVDAVVMMTLSANEAVLKRGAILVDPKDQSRELRSLFALQTEITGSTENRMASRQNISQHLCFVEVDERLQPSEVDPAAFLDYRRPKKAEFSGLPDTHKALQLTVHAEPVALVHAVSRLIQPYVENQKRERETQHERTRKAIEERLKVIEGRLARSSEDVGDPLEYFRRGDNYYYHSVPRSRDLETRDRLQERLTSFSAHQYLTTAPPRIIACALVIPIGYIEERLALPPTHTADPDPSEQAINIVRREELRRGYLPEDVRHVQPGYDIESRDPQTGHLRFLLVKEITDETKTVRLSKSQVLAALNSQGRFQIALVWRDRRDQPPCYAKPPVSLIGFNSPSVIFEIGALLNPDRAQRRSADRAADNQVSPIALDEDDILSCCARRFDSEKYRRQTGFDHWKIIKGFLASGAWGEIRELQLLATFGELQKSLMEFGLEDEPKDGRYWRAFRSLFMLVYDREIPEPYRIPGGYHEWETRYRSSREQCLEHIQGIHRRAVYRDSE